jgi:hypothetical protein
MSGYILLHRSALNHDVFRRDQHSEFEAWVWLLSEAAWKPRQQRLGEHLVDLGRGQIVASIRYLMKAWRWSQHKTERFLKRLSEEKMLATQTATGITVLTICNYDKYQIVPDETATESATPTATGSATGSATKENTLNTVNTFGGASAPSAEKKSRRKPARPMPDIFPMSEVHRAYAESRGFRYEIPPSFTNFKTKPGPAQEMFEAWKNHHQAKGTAIADLDASWRTWVNNQAKWDAERGKTQSRSVL